jgi:glutathione S-transferase
MRVFGHAISVTTRQVLMALAEKGQTAEVVSIDVFKNEQKQPAHLQRQPFGHIPVLQEGDFNLYETPAILRYIERKWPTPSLTPASLQDAALMDQWLCIEQAYLQPAMQKVVAREGAKHFGKRDPGAEIVEEGRRELAHILDVMDGHLSDREYLGGDRFTLADVVWLAYVPYMQDAGVEHLVDARRRVADWWERVKDRPSVLGCSSWARRS